MGWFVFGFFLSFVVWDWSIVPNNLFPWENKQIDTLLRSVALTLGIFGSSPPWLMYLDYKNR